MDVNYSTRVLALLLFLAGLLPSHAYTFTNGNRVQTTTNLAVYTAPASNSVIITTESHGLRGNTASNTFDGKYTWWYISWDNGTAGWSVDSYIEPVPLLTLLSPNGGETWTTGATYTVAWTITGDTSAIGYQLVALSNGGANFANISPALTNNIRSFSWTPTNINSTHVQIRVRAIDAGTYVLTWDISDKDFTVAPPVNPAITNVSPNPVFGANTPQTITLNGTNFVNKPTLTLTAPGQPEYTLPTPSVTYINSTQLQFTLTTGNAPGTWTVKATNPDGRSSSPYPFQVTPPAPTLANPRLETNTFTLDLPTQTNCNYTLEFKGNLNAPTWTLLQTNSGTGATLTLTNLNAPPPTGFYRVHVYLNGN